MPTRLIVTHKSPDLDAIASVWLLKRFDEQHFGEAEVTFVNAGDQISIDELSQLGRQSYEVTHVDTGGGEFDHHTEALADEQVSAASLVYNHLQEIHPEIVNDEALATIVNHVVAIDHFQEVFWPEINQDRAYFYLAEIVSHLKTIGLADAQVLEYGLVSLDAVHAHLSAIEKAKDDVAQATTFQTKWGEAIASESSNTDFITYAQKQGFVVVIRKDLEYGHIRIKALPGKGVDLSAIYEKILHLDPDATWYLHPSKTMLLNGSDKRKNQVASSLSLKQVIEICHNE